MNKILPLLLFCFLFSCEKKERLEPRLEESKGLFKEGLGQLIEGVKVLFGRTK